MSSKYNGWTNYETWNFNLWITNEEPDYEYALELAEDSENINGFRKKLEDWANDTADECISSATSEFGFITDMIYSSIKSVNFYEIAEHLWETRQEAIREHDGEEEE
jgi:hypothetical protein